MRPAIARGIGFVVTMVGLGLCLDSTWQTLGATVLLVGCVLGAWGLSAGAFVQGNDRE